MALLLDSAETAIQRAFLDAVFLARGAVDIQALILALERGDIAEALDLLRLDDARLWPLQEAIRTSFIDGAWSAASGLPASLQGRFGFNGRHPRAEAIIADQGAELVEVIQADHVDAMRAVILDGMQRNRVAPSVARDITGRMNQITKRREGGIIGLTSQQTDYVIRARQQLQDLDPRYFTRERRDRRFDAAVKRAINDGKPLSPAEIERIVSRYKDRLLDYRGKLIARNEAHTAQASGRHEAYLQMLADPEVEAVTVRWQHSPQRQGRPDHIGMDGQKVMIGQDFVLPDGTRMSHPHDPRGGAKHSAGCKCIGIYRPVYRRD